MSIKTVPQILDQWPNRAAIHQDASVADGSLKRVAIHRWYSRNSIPARFWLALLQGAESRGIDVKSIDFLAAHASEEDAA